jgi:hypothetical protein
MSMTKKSAEKTKSATKVAFVAIDKDFDVEDAMANCDYYPGNSVEDLIKEIVDGSSEVSLDVYKVTYTKIGQVVKPKWTFVKS